MYHSQTSTSVSPIRHLRLQHKHLAFVCPLHCVSACWKASWFSGEGSKVGQSSFWKSRAPLLQRRGSDVSLTIGLLDIIWGGTQIIFYCAWCVINTQKKSPSPILIFLFSLLTSIDPPLPSRGLSIYSSPPKVAAAVTRTGRLGMFQITRFVKIIYKLKQLGSQWDAKFPKRRKEKEEELVVS